MGSDLAYHQLQRDIELGEDGQFESFVSANMIDKIFLSD